MSKQKRGMFRRMVDVAKRAIGSQPTKHYADPALVDPRLRQKKRAGSRYRRNKDVRPLIKRGHLGPPKCVPGTVSYRDWLVRELGYDRQLAEGYLYAWRNGYKVKMPMPGDLAI